MIPIILFVGKSGSGKTTLMEQVIAELGRRGRRVAAVKHAAHQLELDRLREHGAQRIGIPALEVQRDMEQCERCAGHHCKYPEPHKP